MNEICIDQFSVFLLELSGGVIIGALLFSAHFLQQRVISKRFAMAFASVVAGIGSGLQEFALGGTMVDIAFSFLMISLIILLTFWLVTRFLKL